MNNQATTPAANRGSVKTKPQQNFTTTSDTTEIFRAAMADAVMIVNGPIIADGKLHRIHVDGDKRGTKNGAYILHADCNPSGWFQHFRTGVTGKWTASGKREPFTAAMRQQIDAEIKQRKAEEQERQNIAAGKAGFIWGRSQPVKGHDYLTAKHVQQHNARLYRNALVIPIYDQDKRLVNLQFINADGTKRFLSGGRKKFCFSVIGKPDEGAIALICEGWATGASLHEHTGRFVVVAMDAGNLEPVALVIRCMYPGKEIVICGDNDLSGVGQKAARAAALAVGGKYLIPDIAGADWNDVLTGSISYGI